MTQPSSLSLSSFPLPSPPPTPSLSLGKGKKRHPENKVELYLTVQDVYVFINKMYLAKTDMGVVVVVKLTITKLFNTFQHLTSVTFRRWLHVIKFPLFNHNC